MSSSIQPICPLGPLCLKAKSGETVKPEGMTHNWSEKVALLTGSFPNAPESICFETVMSATPDYSSPSH
jgi:hypothetical protein